MSHFNMSWEQAFNEVPYNTLVMLSASAPRYEPKENKNDKGEVSGEGNHLYNILENMLPPDQRG